MKHKPPVSSVVTGPAGRLIATTEGEGGVPVLFIHGNAADQTHWTEAQHGLQTRTVAFDSRGCGVSSGGHGPFGVEAGIEDALAVADALLPGRFVLVGHGFGGAVAGAFASYYPERVAGLLYVEAPGDLRHTPAAERDALLQSFTAERYGTFHEHWLEPQLLDATAATRTRVTGVLRTSRREVIEGNLASLFQHDPADAFASYTGLTHALGTSARPETLIGQYPSLSRSIASHSSPWIMLDQPGWFHAELVHFLGQVRHPH